MMILQTVWDVLLFAVFVFGVGAACAPDWRDAPQYAFILGSAGALGLAFVAGFAGFAAGLGNPATAAVVALLGLAIIAARRRSAAALLAHGDVRALLTAWALFAGWSLALLALVVTYSGGGWCVDWVEHWQRTVFFAARQPLGTRFVGVYSLTARPPLANLVIALALAGSRVTFAGYQVFMTLFSSLVALPAFVLAARWLGRKVAGWWVVLLLMLSPLVAENVTFAWTKLPTAFFALTAVALVLESYRSERANGLRDGAALCLALAMLTHYSAGPWVIALAAGCVAAGRPQWRDAAFWRQFARPAAVFSLVLGIWVAWGLAEFGYRGMMEANTTTGAWQQQTPAQRVSTAVLNLTDTIVPFPLRGEPTDGLITQHSRLGRVRDVAFNLYQINLLFAVGLSGLWVLAQALRLRARPRQGEADTPAPGRTFLLTTVPTVIVIGVFVHTPRDQWGLAHICLQPLIIMALAAVAAALPRLSRPARTLWAVLAAVDFVLGVVLQFGLESWRFARFVAPGADRWAFVRQLNPMALGNAADKWARHLTFFADRLHAPAVILMLWLALCFGATIVRLRTSPSHLVHG